MIKFKPVSLVALLCFLLSSIGSVAGLSDGFSIRGIVTDSISGEGVSYVTISIQNAGGIVEQLACDEAGKFSVSLNKPGKYEVVFHAVGYSLRAVDVTLSIDDPDVDMENVSLVPSVEELGEVTVAVQKPLI